MAAYSDNQQRFQVFDQGRTFQAEYLPVKGFSVGGNCLLYADNQNHLKMVWQGEVSTLEITGVSQYEALDYLAVYSIGGIVKIVENGKVTTVSTHSVKYLADDSLVTFYDSAKQLLAVYYNGRIRMLEDGLTGRTGNNFRTADNLVAWYSPRSSELKVFWQGQINTVETFSSTASFKAGRNLVAYVSPSDQQFKVYYKGELQILEDFPPQSFQTGDDVVAWVDNSGSFRVFVDGEVADVSSIVPDFYQVRDKLILYGENGYFNVWYGGKPYLLETFTPSDWQAEWNTVVYRDLNKNVKVFTKGVSKVLTYDLAESISLYRDLIVVNKGMNNCNVYYMGRKF
jgi:hypothetical protein